MATIQTRIDDATLKSPVLGRVLYRLAEAGEVLAAGGKALTLVNLEDVYMEIFLPSEQAARLKIGAEARITVDYAPGRAVAGYVSFVSPEAQFTPKQVETRSEREKLMFRVKIRVPEKTGRLHTSSASRRASAASATSRWMTPLSGQPGCRTCWSRQETGKASLEPAKIPDPRAAAFR